MAKRPKGRRPDWHSGPDEPAIPNPCIGDPRMSATVSLVKSLPPIAAGTLVEYIGEDMFSFPVGMVGTVRADDRLIAGDWQEFPVLVEFGGMYPNGKPMPSQVLAFTTEEVRPYR